MKKPIIEFYASKVAEGDRSYLPMLCEHLADRLVYVPLAAPATSSGDTTRVSVVQIREEGGTFVPVFTTEKKFKTWCAAEGQNTTSITLLGGDLCTVLGESCGLLIDRGCDGAVSLAPENVRRIAESGAEPEPAPPPNVEAIFAAPPPPVKEPARVEEPRFSGSDAPVEATIVLRSEVSPGDTLVRPSGAAPQDPMRATSGDMHAESPSSTSTAVQRPVIFSIGGTGEKAPKLPESAEPKKKKSFLSFLKAGK